MPTADLYYFKLRFNTWLLDPGVCLLTPAERSYYMDLLCHCHRSDDGTIPNDNPDALVLMARSDRFESLKRVLQHFTEVRPGRISHWQVMEDKADLGDTSKVNSQSGTRGGLKSGETRRRKAAKRALRKQRSAEREATKPSVSVSDRDHGASAPPQGARSREMSTPQSVPQPSPAGSAPAARAGGAAPARPALTEVLPPREKWPLTASDYLNREGWRVHPVTGQDSPPDGWTSRPVGGAPVEPAAPRKPEPPPKITREERAAAVRAQAAAIKAQATPEQLAEIEERLAAQDAAAHPAPAAIEGGDA